MFSNIAYNIATVHLHAWTKYEAKFKLGFAEL